MVWFAIVKLAAISYGTVAALRVRFAPALVLVVSTLLTVVLPIFAWFRPGSAIVGALLAEPWAALAMSAALGALATRRAFTALDGARAGSDAEDAMSTVAFALLGNTLIDAGVLVIVLLGMLLMS
jgi:nicotinamide riboside transporter PnuC